MADVIHRDKLIKGMCSALVEKPLQCLTIADIVRHAQVSKRTFYEQFDSKDECFLALYLEHCRKVLNEVKAASDNNSASWEERLKSAI